MTELPKPVQAVQQVVAKVRGRWGKRLLIAGGVLLALVLAGGWYTTTIRFRAWLRARVVTALEDATGGRVELGSFHMIPFRLRFEGRDLTIHGKEQAGGVPFAHADVVVAEVEAIPLVGGKVVLQRLTLEHPVVRVDMADDGSSNIPEPKGPPDSRPAPEQLFDLSIAHLDVHNGEVLWNDRQIPVDFAASGIFGGMSHSLFRRRYEGKVHLEKVETRLPDWRAFAWGGDAEFGLTRRRLDISSLSLTSGRARLHFTGALVDFVHPQVSGTYTAQVDLVEAGVITRTKELAAGSADIKGEGRWTDTAFSATGKLTVRDGLWKMDNAGLRVASGSTQYALSDRLEFHNLQARALGGVVEGDLRVNHWLAPTVPRGKKGDESVGEVHLKLRDLAAGEMLSLLNSPDFPVDRLHAVGSASGTLESKWTRRIETADTEVDLSVTAPGEVAPGTLPLSGTAHGTYHGTVGGVGDSVDIAQIDLNTRGTHMAASGALGSKASNLHMDISASNLAEYEALLSGFRGPAQAPFNLSGHGKFTGWLTGDLHQPQVAGKVELADFQLTSRGGSHSALEQMRWDRLTMDLQASSHTVTAQHGVLQQGNAQVNFDAHIGLDHGAFTPESPVHAKVALQDASVEELQGIFGYHYPIAGRVSFSGELGGNKGSPHGAGDLQLRNATVYGEAVPSAHAKVTWAGAELALQDIDAEYVSGHVLGGASYNLDAGTFRSELTGNGFELARLPKLRDSPTPVAGVLSFKATGSGTAAEPSVNAKVDLAKLAFGDEDQGDFHIEASTRNGTLHLSGKSSFQQQTLSLEGDVRLHDDWPMQASARLEHVDLDPLLQRYLRGGVTGHSSFTGNVTVRGPALRPADLEITAEVDQLTASLQNVTVANDGPVRIRVAQHVFQLEEAHLVGDNTKLTAGGTIAMTGSRELNLHASGQVNLGLLQTMYPDFLTTGSVDIQARATGTASEPVLQGKVTVAGGGVSVVGQPASLGDINGTLVFTQDRLQIEQLTARSGGGLIHLGGYMQYGRYLEFNVTAQGEDVRLRYPPGMSSTANADLRLSGTSNGAVVSGELQITRFSLSPGFDFGAYLASNRQSGVLSGSDSQLNKIKFDLHIYTTPDLRFDSSLARVSGDADLRLRGTMAKPVLLGRTNIQEGQIFFNGAKYELERGDISFTNPVKIDPVLDLAASIRVRDYDIEIGFHGTSDKLNVVYRSEPPLPQADIIALLALGRTQEESAQVGASQSAFTQEASSAILGQAINATVSNRVQKLFGVSRIKIDPQAPGTETSTYQGPQVTIEQQVSNKLTLTYVQPVSQATQQTIQGEYNVTRNVSIVAVRDQNGVFALDIRIRHRKR